MHVEALWRYPVESLAGEALEQADLTPDGADGVPRVGSHPWNTASAAAPSTGAPALVVEPGHGGRSSARAPQRTTTTGHSA